ncbi:MULTISPECIES: response regulator transcription factor [unclassified Streptomyces]|uniref:response regulator transcription factor n=1 Tax=unclassified Streptomyces TaxID=2593676 RepID=UPI002E784ECC|nr:MULTISPECIES: response regulator transcription factor [unclassified Streptomyces]MEE1763254.1 response regulator transcription factor [Streptomyces sp. SP18BB07]MEE1837235.1 response regulator transcription factor [Streptomyces sp. SP17KL33]
MTTPVPSAPSTPPPAASSASARTATYTANAANASTARLLVVDEEEGIRSMLTMALEFLGHQVTAAATGRQALQAVTRYDPDLILLDVNLPDLSGFEVCRTLRERGNAVPVLFLTGLGSVDDRVRGLDMGGDDIVSKPFELKEIAARVRALLRRAGGGHPAPDRNRLRAGAVQLDADAHQVWADGRSVDLTTTEFALLRYLMENPGRVLSRRQIQERVWNHRDEGSGVVDTYIYYLRRKLGEPGQSLIRTVRGVGYQLCAKSTTRD